MKKMQKLAAFARKNAGRVVACSLLLAASASFGQETGGTPTGVLESFDVATAGTAIRTVMLTVLGIIGTVYGASLGYVFLRWVYRKVVGALGK